MGRRMGRRREGAGWVYGRRWGYLKWREGSGFAVEGFEEVIGEFSAFGEGELAVGIEVLFVVVDGIAFGFRDDEDIASSAAIEGVGFTDAGVELVISGVAFEEVCAGSSEECVISGPADEVVIAVAAEDEVVSVFAPALVVTGVALDGIVAVVAEEEVIAVGAEDVVISESAVDVVIACAAVDLVMSACAGEVVVAVAAGDVVGAGAAVDGVVACAAGDVIGAAAAEDGVIAVAAVEDVVAVCADDGVIAGAAVGPAGEGDVAVGFVDLEEVVTGVADEIDSGDIEGELFDVEAVVAFVIGDNEGGGVMGVEGDDDDIVGGGALDGEEVIDDGDGEEGAVFEVFEGSGSGGDLRKTERTRIRHEQLPGVVPSKRIQLDRERKAVFFPPGGAYRYPNSVGHCNGVAQRSHVVGGVDLCEM